MTKYLVIIFCLLTTNVMAKDLLLESCQKRNGHIKKAHFCPKSKIPIPARTCFYQNQDDEYEFFNGCSGPTGGFKEIFYPTCIKHDLCYHNEPRSNGRSQKSCDLEFLRNLQTACKTKTDKTASCLKWAKSLYRALRIIGKPAYHCANNLRNY